MVAAEHSLEVIPPPATSKAPAAAFAELASLNPAFVAVAAYPGTLPPAAAVSLLRAHFMVPLVPHLTSRDCARAALPSLLDRLQHAGVSHMVVVRGDASSDLPAPFDFPHSIDLIAEIRRKWRSGELRIEAGAHPEGHPEGHGPAREVDYLLAKLDAGADGLITQFCYDAEAVIRMRDRLAAKRKGIPLRAGVLLARDLSIISQLVTRAGVTLPAALRKALVADRDDANGGSRTLDYLGGLVKDLHEAGIPPHLYTMNDAEAARGVLERAELVG